MTTRAPLRAGDAVEDFCRVCKEVRDHRVIAVSDDVVRVICGWCQSQHNYRGGRTPGERRPAPVVSSGPAVVRRRADGSAEVVRASGETAGTGSRAGAGAGAGAVSGYADLPHSGDELVSERERAFPPIELEGDPMDIEMMLRRVIREECGLTPVAPADKWRGGKLVMEPGKPGVQMKEIPIDTFFHKIVMLRNRLRVLEQKINSSKLPEDEKLDLQSYVTGCYGSLTTFNVLFAEEGDKFKGQGGND